MQLYPLPARAFYAPVIRCNVASVYDLPTIYGWRGEPRAKASPSAPRLTGFSKPVVAKPVFGKRGR